MLWTLFGEKTLLKNILIFAFTFAVQIYFKRVKNRVLMMMIFEIRKSASGVWVWKFMAVGGCGQGQVYVRGVSIFRNWQTEQRWSGASCLNTNTNKNGRYILSEIHRYLYKTGPPHVYLVSNEVSLSHTDTHQYTDYVHIYADIDFEIVEIRNRNWKFFSAAFHISVVSVNAFATSTLLAFSFLLFSFFFSLLSR